MDDRTKREIKGLVQGIKDPRLMLAPIWYVSFTISLQVVALVLVLIDLKWGLIIASGYFAIYVAVMTLFMVKAKRTKAQLLHNDFDLCLWCHYPMVGLPDRGRCAECGCGYDRQVAQKLFKEAFDPTFSNALRPNKMARRTRWWARVLRERDRVQP